MKFLKVEPWIIMALLSSYRQEPLYRREDCVMPL